MSKSHKEMPRHMPRKVRIGSHAISDESPSFIIAEIGINHEGSLDQCLQMIDRAAEAGANAVKLQTVISDLNYAPCTESHSVFTAAELSPDETAKAFDHAKSVGIECFSTCADRPSINLIKSIGPSAWKISSGLLTHLPLIEELASTKIPILLSTGLATMDEVRSAYHTAKSTGNNDIAIFQCTSIYPCPDSELNINIIATFRKEFGVPIGFSDHSAGIDAAPLAVACGARLIEKHFTLDSSRNGFDHAVSLEPSELKEMISRVRSCEAMLGTYEKEPSAAQEVNRKKYLRTISTNKSLPKGHVIKENDLIIVRLGPDSRSSLLPPEMIRSFIGLQLSSELMPYQPLTEDHFS